MMFGSRSIDRPLFEVIIPTSTPAERRLVTAAAVRAMIGSPEADDDVLDTIIDGVSAACASYCKLARAGTAPATFGRESVRATWYARQYSYGSRGDELSLPWRVPISEIEVSEDAVDLVATDFRLFGGAVIQRVSSTYPGAWSSGALIVDYTAGWLLGVDASAYDGEADAPPADLVARVIEQVKMAYLNRQTDPALRSESVDGVWSGSYNIPGGDSIGKSGLLVSLETALAPYRKPTFA